MVIKVISIRVIPVDLQVHGNVAHIRDYAHEDSIEKIIMQKKHLVCNYRHALRKKLTSSFVFLSFSYSTFISMVEWEEIAILRLCHGILN